MKIRADVAALLRQGLSNKAISQQLRVDRATVAEARTALRLPPVRLGSTPRPLADLFAERTAPVDGGHLRWTGTVNSTGTAVLNQGKGPRSAARAAFLLRHGREPVGHVRAGCDYPKCLAPEHVEDQPMRDRTNATFAAIFGQAVGT